MNPANNEANASTANKEISILTAMSFLAKTLEFNRFVQSAANVSLADAESAEYLAQKIVGGKLPGDRAK